jgi:hypothetical protein
MAKTSFIFIVKERRLLSSHQKCSAAGIEIFFDVFNPETNIIGLNGSIVSGLI